MKAPKPCKRGNISDRDKYGQCLCVDCKKYRYSIQKTRKKETNYQSTWQKNNKDKVKEYTQRWNHRNKLKRKNIVDSWRKRNPDKVKAMNKRGGKKWASNNKGKRNAIDMRRKAALIKRTPSWADLDKIKLFYLEAERLTKATGIPHEVDHIIPLQGKLVSGLHVHNNLQVITRSENRSKQNKVNL